MNNASLGNRGESNGNRCPVETGMEWARLPDIERIFGLKRSTVYELIWANKIRSSCIRRKGARSGVRLVDVDSVREFIRSQTA